jgi:ATP-dependent Clp protease adaptor protein ClpS
MNAEQATDVMLAIHYKGKGRCGTFTAEVAETKVDQVLSYATSNEHPLKCTMEKA